MRWGFASFAAAQVNVEVPGDGNAAQPETMGVVAIGPRFGLLRRTDAQQWMPALSLLVGASLHPKALNPFTELRLELLHTSGGGPLQPNFLVYLTGGVTQSAALKTLSPHAGFGVGWNIWPGASTLSLGGSGAATALMLMLMLFAGRIEARYIARPFLGPGNDYVALMFGAGT